ncbi:MAG: nucleotide pyrophosphohydrolase [Pirellulales bacterium]|nr:nucleotide pyrophosphohydrolase [Pirellulales bacterium]
MNRVNSDKLKVFDTSTGARIAVCANHDPAGESRPEITLTDLQQLIRRMYLAKDAARGIDGTFMWLIEEVGELASALREGSAEQQSAEFADVLAWLVTIANVAGIDLTEAVARKYGSGCPGCGHFVCTCPDSGKP